jgi:hypothetical protein
MNTTTFYWACVVFAVHFRFATGYKNFDDIDFEDPDNLYPGSGKKIELPVTPAPTQCPVDDPDDSQDPCNYEYCCNQNKEWCSNSCGNIYDDNATICHELWVSIKNVCVCNYLGANNCPDDFRGQILNTAYCANGPDVCEPSPTPRPTPSPTTSNTANPTKNSHPCGNDSCQHTCKIFPDPNYITWSNHHYAFHGSCDQIAIDNDNIQVQIRTEQRWARFDLPRFSTITAVGILFKITDETFYYYYDAYSRAYVIENNLTRASVQSFANDKITINDTNFIKLTSPPFGSEGVTLEVLGSGGYMFGSVGMCGSWNNGHARYRNGDIFDTAGGFGPQTYKHSYSLAQDWRVPVSKLDVRNKDFLPLGARTCVDSNISSRGLRTPSKINAVHTGCQEMNCDKIDSKLFRKACEADIAITGDTSWACADILMNHEAILEVSPSDFELTESIEEFYRQDCFV